MFKAVGGVSAAGRQNLRSLESLVPDQSDSFANFNALLETYYITGLYSAYNVVDKKDSKKTICLVEILLMSKMFNRHFDLTNANFILKTFNLQQHPEVRGFCILWFNKYAFGWDFSRRIFAPALMKQRNRFKQYMTLNDLGASCIKVSELVKSNNIAIYEQQLKQREQLNIRKSEGFAVSME